METMPQREFAEMKKCTLSKVQDAIHGRGAQRLNSIIVSVKGKGRAGSRRREVILDELAEKFEGGVRSRKTNAVEMFLQEDRVDFNRPVPVSVYGYVRW